MNYCRGGEQENINLTLILNPDFAPRHHSVSSCHPCASFRTNQSEGGGIVGTLSCLVHLNLSEQGFPEKNVWVFKTLRS